MRALLVEPRTPREWGNNNQFVGLLRVARWLEVNGHDIRYTVYPDIPGPLEFMPDEVYVTSMFTYDYPGVWEAVRECKQRYPGAKVILGGVYATLCPDHAQLSGADEVVVGRHPEARFHPPNPALLPKQPKRAYLFSSYGCNRACTYCATHLLFGKGIEQSSPDTVVDEIEFLVENGFRRIRFGDDNILYNAESHINVICEEILSRGLKAKFEVPGGMTASELTRDTLDLMRRAGFEWFSFAIESVSLEVRKQMGRATHVGREELEEAVAMCEESGISRKDIDVYFLIGLPYQSLEDMVDTLLFLLHLGVWAHPQRLTPIPGTHEWKRMGLEEWDYKDLHYKTFVAPDQDRFTGEDLDAIYTIARTFNMGSRMAKKQNWITEPGLVHDLFRNRLQTLIN